MSQCKRPQQTIEIDTGQIIPYEITAIMVDNKVKVIDRIVVFKHRVDYERDVDLAIAGFLDSDKGKWVLTKAVSHINIITTINVAMYGHDIHMMTRMFTDDITFFHLKWG